MQIVTGILNGIGRLWNRGCFGKVIVSFLALLVIGICAAPFRRATPPTALAPSVSAPTAVVAPTRPPEPTGAPEALSPTRALTEQPIDVATEAPKPTALPKPTNTSAPAATALAVSTSAPTEAPTEQPISAATEVPTPRLPPPVPPLPPPTFNACQEDPNPDAAPNYPVLIVAIDKRAEMVTLKNVSTDPVDLAGWHMCSFTGNQEHPIGGTLAPGQSQTFPGPSGSIWNNSSPDPGALYNPNGQLVSYFNS